MHSQSSDKHSDNNLLCCIDESSSSDSRSRKKAADASVLPRLRVLRLSGNRLKHMDAARFPNLRTFYVDNNLLADSKSGVREQSGQTPRKRLTNLHRLSKLENFSARNQNGPGARDASLYVAPLMIQCHFLTIVFIQDVLTGKMCGTARDSICQVRGKRLSPLS